MPEHIHLLLTPRKSGPGVPPILWSLKRTFAVEVLARWRAIHAPVLARLHDSRGRYRFWQPGGGYDRNIFSMNEYLEKIGYIHRNPVDRGLVEHPTDWRWSSARAYLGGGEVLLQVDRAQGV